MSRAAPAAAFAAALLGGAPLAGCGADDEPDRITTQAAPRPTTVTTATAPATTMPPAATATARATTAQAPRTAPGEEGQGGGGDEEPIRVPATFAVRGTRIEPSQVTVPAFLRVQVTAASADHRDHTVQVAAGRRVVLRVPAGGRASGTVPGLRPGSYPVTVDGRRAGAIVSGGEPGP